MTLASMVSLDRTALICDIAETYGIHDIRSLDLFTLATLAAGLRDNARIKQKARGEQVSQETLLLAIIADGINGILWSLGRGKTERPASIAEILMKPPAAEKKKATRKFTSGEEYEKTRLRILKKIKGE